MIAWVEGGCERERSLFIEAVAKEGELRVESKIKLAIPPSLSLSFYLSLPLSVFFFAHSLPLPDSFIDLVRRRVR